MLVQAASGRVDIHRRRAVRLLHGWHRQQRIMGVAVRMVRSAHLVQGVWQTRAVRGVWCCGKRRRRRMCRLMRAHRVHRTALIMITDAGHLATCIVIIGRAVMLVVLVSIDAD